MASGEQLIWKIHDYTVYNAPKLGRGAFGIVYKAKDKTGLIIAAKEISVDKHKKQSFKEAVNFYKLTMRK